MVGVRDPDRINAAHPSGRQVRPDLDAEVELMASRHASDPDGPLKLKSSCERNASGGSQAVGDLQTLIADVAHAVASSAAERERRVAQALHPYLGRTGLLGDELSRCSPDRYVRHLLHQGPDYTILSLVWRPGQMSPVHAHRTWCAFGLHQGSLVESVFRREPAGATPDGSIQLRVGEVGYSAPGDDFAHRLANLCIHNAVSIHVYGAPYERLGDSVNQIWAA